MLEAFQAEEDARRAAMGALGAEAVAGLHGPWDEAASTLEAARGALGGLYARLRGPRTLAAASLGPCMLPTASPPNTRIAARRSSCTAR